MQSGFDSVLTAKPCVQGNGHLASEMLISPLSLLSGGKQGGKLGAAGGLQEPLAKGHMAEDSGLIWGTGSIQELKKLSGFW